jgi:hypothetical protein
VTESCDWYLAEARAGRILGRWNRPIKASTLAMDESRIETHIKPLVGRTLVRALKIADIERMQSDIVAGKTAKPQGGAGVASRRAALVWRLEASRRSSILGRAARLDRIEAHSEQRRSEAGREEERNTSQRF